MRLKEFETQQQQQIKPKPVGIWTGKQTKIYTMFIKVTGVTTLSFRPAETTIWIGDYPIHEIGSNIEVDSLGEGDGYIVMADCVGLYTMVLQGLKDFKVVEQDYRDLTPELMTERGRFKIPDGEILLGSCYLVDFDAKRSMTLIRSANNFEQEEELS